MARRRVRSGAQWRQPLLPELAEQLAESATEPPAEQPRAQVAGADWEERCFREACRAAGQLAVVRLAALEGHLHAQRPRGYVVEGWRERTLVTRFGDVRARRRLYTAPDGTAHFLLDEHLGWPPRQVATPAFAALLVDWATEVPFRTAARRVEAATAGVVGGSTAWRLLQQVAARVVAHEQAVHAAWAATATLPAPAGERVVPVLYVEADGVWVKTQREPDHRTGYELKCASRYEGWEQIGKATPGHPRDHYRLVAKQVYCHGFARADAKAPVPFWEAVDLALARTYDLSQIPVVVVGGDGANWLDTALESFPQGVRQRDGFHLARDAARGWGVAVGATLYQAVRTGDQATALEALALPAPTRALALLPPPVAEEPLAATTTTVTAAQAPPAPPLAATTIVPMAPPAVVSTGASRGTQVAWSVAQMQRARTTFTRQVGSADAAVDWRRQVAPELVPSDARALGTQEGTNAHLLAKRMKHKGMAWTASGARHMAKARELVTNGTFVPWCLRPAAPRPAPVRAPGGYAPRGSLPWPQVMCTPAHGPLTDPTAATLHHIDRGGRARHRLP